MSFVFSLVTSLVWTLMTVQMCMYIYCSSINTQAKNKDKHKNPNSINAKSLHSGTSALVFVFIFSKSARFWKSNHNGYKIDVCATSTKTIGETWNWSAEGAFGSLSLLSHCSSLFVSYNIHYLRHTNYRPIIEPLLMFVLCYLKIALRKVSIEQAVVENIFLDVQH